MMKTVQCLLRKNILASRQFSLSVTYDAVGAPSKVLKLGSSGPLPKIGDAQVHVKMLAAPINPADMNMVEGVYGVQPKLPAVAGGEGVGVVQKVGTQVKGLKTGDWVIPASAASGFGTWQQEVVSDATLLQKVPNDIPVPYAATIGVNPCTAYRMLRDFVSLKPGDVIIQNGANSMVGLCVIQMARELGVKTINIVRSDRPDIERTLSMLANFGGDINVPDSYVNTSGFHEILSELPPVKLALNCVGGESLTNIARSLPYGASIVTYGGMSKRPMTIPYELLTYKALTLSGFWVSKWHTEASVEARSAMIEDIAELIRSKKIISTI